MKNADQPAFPSEFEGPEKDEFGMPLIVHRKCYGLTKREMFAAMAMQGMLANPDATGKTIQNGGYPIESFAEQAVMAADKLLKQLES